MGIPVKSVQIIRISIDHSYNMEIYNHFIRDPRSWETAQITKWRVSDLNAARQL